MGNSRATLAAALFGAMSCGSSKPVANGPAPLAGASQKTYAPMSIKADAKQTNQAVILGTDEHNGSTVLPIAIGTSNAVVDAMWVKLGPHATGGSTPVKLGTGPNADRSVQVGIFEELSGGTGPQWRAGVWVAALVAATTLNKDLTDFAFTASSGGYIDGASASGLMTGGFLAAMTGAKVDPSVTMTGIINPDGSIGPVGGIPEKFLGLIEKGKKRLGYPIGMQKATSEATHQEVDLVELAKSHGAEAVEIADVYEAYQLLTGKQLPSALPVPESEMALDPETATGLENGYKALQKKLAEQWAPLTELETAARLPRGLVALRKAAQEQAEAAEKLHGQGKLPVAYLRAMSAWSSAYTANKTYAIVAKVQAHDLDGAAQLVDALDRSGELVDVFKRVGALKPTTLGGHLQVLSAFQSTLRGWVAEGMHDRTTAQTREWVMSLKSESAASLADPDHADQIVEAVEPAAVESARVLGAAVMAEGKLEFEHETTVNYMCSIPNVKRMSTSFQSAAAAGINYFDQLLIAPAAQANGMTEDQVRDRVAQREPDYLVAYMTSHVQNAEGLPGDLKALWGDGSFAWNVMSLASNELAYYEAGALIAKYYSLDAHTDDNGKIDKVEHEKAFATMLARAERTARANARAARVATGGIPVQAKLAYQVATFERDGDLGERLDALQEFWLASAFSQTAVMLARN